MCLCVCMYVLACMWEREKDRGVSERKREKKDEKLRHINVDKQVV